LGNRRHAADRVARRNATYVEGAARLACVAKCKDRPQECLRCRDRSMNGLVPELGRGTVPYASGVRRTVFGTAPRDFLVRKPRRLLKLSNFAATRNWHPAC
jgi:hypothetical protein